MHGIEHERRPSLFSSVLPPYVPHLPGLCACRLSCRSLATFEEAIRGNEELTREQMKVGANGRWME